MPATPQSVFLCLCFSAATANILVAQSLGPPVKDGRVRSINAEASLGSGENLRRAYEKWLRLHERSGGSRNVVIALGWSKGLSNEFSRAKGIARLDLFRGRVAIDVGGPGHEILSDVWLVDNRPRSDDTVAPEKGDELRFLGRLVPGARGARLTAELGEDAFRDFDVDLVVVTRADRSPLEGGVLFGSPGLFERMHRRDERVRLGLPPEAGAQTGQRRKGKSGSVGTQSDPLVEAGRELFFEETFEGNGRTCGTCHPASNNLTIDPTFIATLPPRDPLFVAEFVPELANNFENPTLMRKAGLILENVDGFGDLANKFVMRGVPHTFALPTSLQPAPEFEPGKPELRADFTTFPPIERTGWSGDGSPGSGTLREFAIGAVTQHFTRRLDRVNGVDFRLPSDPELDAMAAFQLSLGRQADIDLASLTFRSEVVRRGQALFLDDNVGKCNQCHVNAGANVSFIPGGFNFNFDTGVENLPDQPADLIDSARNPPDAGFGQAPFPAGGFGDGSFNVPPLIESADTGPFFHNNAIETIEEAVNFYNSDAFNKSPSGLFLGGIKLQATQVVAIAAMLRALNALENIDQSIAAEKNAIEASTFADAKPFIQSAIDELEDAIEVLRCGRLHPGAVRQLAEALAKDALALITPSRALRNALLRQAIADKNAARGDIVR